MQIPGLKIFMINVDLTAEEMDSLVMNVFLKGYELHFLLARSGEAIEKQIKRMVDVFEEIIIFINIDRQLSDINSYTDFIKKINNEFQCSIPLIGGEEEIETRSVRIGVLHSVSPNKINRESENKLEYYYLNTVMPCAGFFAFDIHLQVNIKNLLNYLDSYEYLRGYRRHTIRIICREACEKINYIYEGAAFQFRLLDISISHFSVLIPHDLTPKQFTKLENIQIFLKSAILRTDCVLTLVKQGNNSGSLCVFTFLHSVIKTNNREIEVHGLNEKNRQKASQVILKGLKAGVDNAMIE